MTVVNHLERFFLSALTVAITANSVASSAQAFPKLDPSFSLQALRLQELDIREGEAPRPEVSSPDPSLGSHVGPRTGADYDQAIKPSKPNSQPASLIEQRRQLLDRRNK